MPELKLIRAPTNRVDVVDRHGVPVDISSLERRRIKRTKRVGDAIRAYVEDPNKGAKGTLLIFGSPDDYEKAIVRIFRPNDSR